LIILGFWAEIHHGQILKNKLYWQLSSANQRLKF
jgi:hypothetical protein